MRNLFWLCLILLIITSLGCPPKPTDPPVLFPVDGALLSPDSLGTLTFTWPDLKDPQGNPPERFELFRLDAANVDTARRDYTFSKVMDMEITKENSFTFQGLDLGEVTAGRQYFWQIVGSPVKEGCRFPVAFHTFTVDALDNNSGSRGPRPYLQVDPPETVEICDTFYRAPNCTQIDRILCKTVGGPIAHIVNLDDEDFLSNSLSMRSNEGGRVNNIGCVRADSPTFSFYFRFFIDVPCNKKGQLLPENINLYLFSDANRNVAKTINYTTVLNDDAANPQNASTQIVSADYKSSCIGYCTSICRAVVEISGDATIDYQANGDPYEHMFVFDLGVGSSHASGQSGSNTTHAANLGALCPDPPNPPGSYDYFKCVDDLGATAHESDHIVITTVPFCGM